MTQFITSGGGGAFLHPTHALAPTINLKKIPWLGGRVTMLALGRDPNPTRSEDANEALYPPRKKSLEMLKGNFKFALYNPGFALLSGVCYWLLGLIAMNTGWDGLYIVPLILIAGSWSYTNKQEGGGLKVITLSIANAIVHGGAVILLASFFDRFNAAHLNVAQWPRFSFWLFAFEMIVVGSFVGATLFGIYLYISSRCLNLNHNDAFSAMRRDSHRHFLRMCIKNDEVKIYPIALDQVPDRTQWQTNDKHAGSPAPVYVPNPPLVPRLIEGPIVVRVPERP